MTSPATPPYRMSDDVDPNDGANGEVVTKPKTEPLLTRDLWHTCFDPSQPGPGDANCPGCMKEANPMVNGEYIGGRVRECGRWHPEGAVEHNAANCWRVVVSEPTTPASSTRTSPARATLRTTTSPAGDSPSLPPGGSLSHQSASGTEPVQWCVPDDCPAAICGGPHRAVETSIGVEILRADQSPIGDPSQPEQTYASVAEGDQNA